MATNPVPAGSYASRLPRSVLRAHVTLGAIQIAIGCQVLFLAIYELFRLNTLVASSGFWAGPFFIPAGATGLAGGRGGSNAKCCLISCLVLSILAANAAAGAIEYSIIIGFGGYPHFPMFNGTVPRSGHSTSNRLLLGDILWLLVYLLEFVVAVVQAFFACRATCCFEPEPYGHLTDTDMEPAAGAGYTGAAAGAINGHADCEPAPPAYSSIESGSPAQAAPSAPKF